MNTKLIVVFLLLSYTFTYSLILAEKNVKILKFIDEPSCNNGSNQPIKYTNGKFIYHSTLVTQPKYVATSTKSHGVKIDGFLCQRRRRWGACAPPPKFWGIS